MLPYNRAFESGKVWRKLGLASTATAGMALPLKTMRVVHPNEAGVVGRPSLQASPRIIAACYFVLRATRLLMHARHLQSWRFRSGSSVALPIIPIRSTPMWIRRSRNQLWKASCHMRLLTSVPWSSFCWLAVLELVLHFVFGFRLLFYFFPFISSHARLGQY